MGRIQNTHRNNLYCKILVKGFINSKKKNIWNNKTERKIEEEIKRIFNEAATSLYVQKVLMQKEGNFQLKTKGKRGKILK